MAKNLQLQVDARPMQALLQELELELVNAPLQIRKLALDFIDGMTELCRFKQSIATGAMVPLLLEPSDGMFDLLSAVRACDFDALSVKHSHD